MGKGKQKKDGRGVNDKADDLAANTVEDQGEYFTTNQGARVNDDQNTLKDGERGASLLEDFIFREKITHFDHERIPERVVHARGAGAHGFFKAERHRQVTATPFLVGDGGALRQKPADDSTSSRIPSLTSRRKV